MTEELLHYGDILLRLVLAIVLGGAIGLERIQSNHDAGLRTHILVALGSALTMILSEDVIVQGYSGDIFRIGAGVVSGIGFLGAGCILVNGNHVKGLTTAAGLWTTSCVGLAVGMGHYFLAITATVLMLLAMLVLHPLSRHFQPDDDPPPPSEKQ